MNMGGLLGIFFWFVFLKFSTADSDFSDLDFESLIKQNVQLSTSLQTLQNDVKPNKRASGTHHSTRRTDE